tara:strand:+ start:10 stop:195 length:186 start_codon:yes stop_codon:yes gene_type:complete
MSTVLSMNPKATNGTALKTKIFRSVSGDGAGTDAAVVDDLDAADAANPDDGVALHALAFPC